MSLKWWAMVLAVIGSLLAGCSGNRQDSGAVDEPDNEVAVLALPELAPIDLDGGKLHIVATTSIIGDVVAQVGGTAVELTVLMEAGQDPHSYEPGAKELTAVANAHIIFINGWDLEEGLVDDLAAVSGGVPLVPVSARIEPRELVPVQQQADEHVHGSADPHTWLDPHNVKQWVDNITAVLSQLDPGNTAVYDSNAAAYQAQLAELLAYTETQINTIPADGRKLVTNHGAFGYFADRYDFQVIGTVLPAFSALAEPSASGLAALVQTMRDEDICVIFAETTANDQLAQAVAAELSRCTAVHVLPLYTGALGVAGSGADSYIGMIKTNVDTIVRGLTIDK